MTEKAGIERQGDRKTEKALRGVAYGAMGALILLAFAGPRETARQDAIDGDALGGQLPVWTAAPPADSLHVRLTAAASAESRDWLRALASAGTNVSWSGTPPATAVDVEPTGDPAGTLRALVAAPAGMLVTLRDSLGILDSARAAGGGASFTLQAAASGVRATVGMQAARSPRTENLEPRTVAVLARAGWEPKFIIAALEERGWRVDARLALSPAFSVTQGRPLPLDTARHAAVIVLDSLDARDAGAVAGFARRGGGVILGPAAITGTLAGIAPATPGGRQRPSALAFVAAAPRRALGFLRLVPAPGAVVLEREGDGVAAAGRRLGAGRVVQIGYDDTWRWRMAGDDGSVEAHRAWWAAVVSAAAYQPMAAAAVDASADPAPLASMVFAAGEPSATPAARTSSSLAGRLLAPLFAVLLLALLGEWALRRLRGTA